MIKRIIQTWKDTDLTLGHPIFSISQDSWKKHHPAWRYEFFTDEDIDRYVKAAFPLFYKNVFLKYQAPIERVDIFRNITLYQEGGLYCDLDGECLNSFENTVDGQGIILGQLQNQESANKYSNAWMACTQIKEPFWLFTLAEATRRHTLNRGFYVPEYLTGPVLITDCVIEYNLMNVEEINHHIRTYFPDLVDLPKSKSIITLLKPEVIYPIDWSVITTEERKIAVIQRLETGTTPVKTHNETHCIHYWTHTWERPQYSLWKKILLRIKYIVRLTLNYNKK